MNHTIFNTIAFRLSLWFTGIFTICAGVAFFLFYFLATQTLQSQIDLELSDNAAKFSTAIHRNGLMGARELAVVEAQAAGEKKIFIRLLYPTGEVFASSHMSYWKDVHVSQDALEYLVRHNTSVFETIQIPSTHQKARVLYSYIAANAILQTGVAMDSTARFLSAFQKMFMGAMGFIIAFSAVSGWVLIRKTLSGVQTITTTAQNISGSNLDARVPGTGSKNELDYLVTTFNSMLDRIADLVKSIREMSDNIAHDLKSPIARIRGFAELALTDDETIEDYRIMASNTIEESDRLLDMINTMLVISRAEAGGGEFQFKQINLSEMLKEACDLFAPLAEDKELTFSQIIEDRIFISGDIKMLQRAVSNLLDNAIKYTPEKEKVCVSLAVEDHQAVIKIEDSGIGISAEYIEKVFERFYRIESSRSSAGTGLGLSLARTIVRQHKGDIVIVRPKHEPGAPFKGTVFVVTLPYRNFEVIESS